ncbi:MAG: hypothetical protein KAT20_00310, partial [Desulfuromonadales bacterium]|nr:hypothetical protein [Desulfuromonadales bacterium]
SDLIDKLHSIFPKPLYPKPSQILQRESAARFAGISGRGGVAITLNWILSVTQQRIPLPQRKKPGGRISSTGFF